MADDHNQSEKVTIGTKVNPQFKKMVRTLAATQDKSMSQFVREAVSEKYHRELEQTDQPTLDDFLKEDEEGNLKVAAD